MARLPAGTNPKTLRATWIATASKLVAVTVAVGLLAIGVTQYQRVLFASTASELQETTEVTLELEQAFLEVTEPMFGVMYGPRDDSDRYEGAQARYEEARLEVYGAYDRAIETLDGNRAAAELEQARAIWEEVDEVVRASKDQFTDQQLGEFFEQDIDPFAVSVWQRLERGGAHLVAARQVTVTETADRVAATDRVQRLLAPVIVLALVLALVLAYLSFRRMSREVVRPLEEVGRGAQAMRDATAEADIEVPGAVAEVRDLADVINETAEILRNHHLTLFTQARTDAMTTLPNREAFVEGLHRLLDDPGCSRVAVLFLDLDDFKIVNDTQGHAAGDELLRIVSLRLRAATRGCEIAARLGGDEFAVALDASDDQAAASHVAERIRLALSRPAEIDGREVEVGCSIGLAVSGPDASSDDADDLLSNADFAMYMAKSQGKGRYELYSPVMHTEVQSRMELGQDLSQALKRGQFVLHYQPVLDLEAERLLGFEALIRWQHPERGMIAPDDFIGLAESSGDIVPIGAWVLDTACATLARHLDVDPELSMGVNVSPQQLVAPGFVDTVVQALERHGLAPRNLVLEITEATAMTDTEAGLSTLTVLRDRGIHVALDDFGTGYSSLGNLAGLPVDVIKIDRSFISEHSPQATATLRTIILLAQQLGYRVVAEGIENPEDLERLRVFGEVVGQGFLFARPMPEHEMVAYILDKGAARPALSPPGASAAHRG